MVEDEVTSRAFKPQENMMRCVCDSEMEVITVDCKLRCKIDCD